jgi:hypothetical protein
MVLAAIDQTMTDESLDVALQREAPRKMTVFRK